MNSPNKRQIARFLVQVATVEHTIDGIKHRIARLGNQTVSNLFGVVAGSKGYLCIGDLQKLLIESHERQPALFSKVMARFGDGCEQSIGLQQFLKGLTPLEQLNKESGENIKSANHKDEASVLMSTFVRECIRGESYLNRFRRQLKNEDLGNVFRQMNTHRTGYLGLNELMLFMSRCGIQMEQPRCKYLIAALRKNRKFVTLEAFTEAFELEEQTHDDSEDYSPPPGQIRKFMQHQRYSDLPQLSMLKRFASSNLERIRNYRLLMELQPVSRESECSNTAVIQLEKQKSQADREQLPLQPHQQQHLLQENNITFAAWKPQYPPLPITIELVLYSHPSLTAEAQLPPASIC